IVAFFEVRRTPDGMVRVCSQEVDPAAVEQLVGEGFGGFAEAAIERAAGDLDEAALAHPLGEMLRLALDGRVALRMGDYQRVAGRLETEERVFKLRGDGGVRELDHQIALAADGIAQGMGDGVDDIIRGEMEVTTEAQLNDAFQALTQFGE